MTCKRKLVCTRTRLITQIFQIPLQHDQKQCKHGQVCLKAAFSFFWGNTYHIGLVQPRNT